MKFSSTWFTTVMSYPVPLWDWKSSSEPQWQTLPFSKCPRWLPASRSFKSSHLTYIIIHPGQPLPLPLPIQWERFTDSFPIICQSQHWEELRQLKDENCAHKMRYRRVSTPSPRGLYGQGRGLQWFCVSHGGLTFLPDFRVLLLLLCATGWRVIL